MTLRYSAHRTPGRVVAALAAGWCVSIAAGQGSPSSAAEDGAPGPMRALLIDETLSKRAIRLVSLDERSVVYIDEMDRRRQSPRSSILAIEAQHEPVEAPAAEVDLGVLELTDGQRFAGRPSDRASSDDRFGWTHPLLGEVSVELERVSSFARTLAAGHELEGSRLSPPRRDTLLLSNGDRVSGFLASLGELAVLETDEGEVTVSSERIAAARLSNRAETARGLMAWLDDGSAVRASRVTIDEGGRVSLELEAGGSASADWSKLSAVAMSAERLAGLASLQRSAEIPGEGRRYAPPVEVIGSERSRGLGACDILIPGPMSVTWTLPEGAGRVSFVAMLEAGSQPWGDCEVVVKVGNTEAARRRLSSDQREASFAFDVDGRELTVLIESGRYGPIRDRVIVRHGLVRVD